MEELSRASHGFLSPTVRSLIILSMFLKLQITPWFTVDISHSKHASTTCLAWRPPLEALAPTTSTTVSAIVLTLHVVPRLPALSLPLVQAPILVPAVSNPTEFGPNRTDFLLSFHCKWWIWIRIWNWNW